VQKVTKDQKGSYSLQVGCVAQLAERAFFSRRTDPVLRSACCRRV